MTNVLLAGESWASVQFEIKGRNVLQDSQYKEAADRFISMLEGIGASVTHQPCHVAAESFPRTKAALDDYDLVLLSDVGADTLQITQRVANGSTDVDRCSLLAEWIQGRRGRYDWRVHEFRRKRWSSPVRDDATCLRVASRDRHR